MSKEVLHKQINFICQKSDEFTEDNSIYSGKNYGLSLIKHINRRNINLKRAVKEIEERFLATPDKDFLLMIIDSMIKGQRVQVKKMQAMKKDINNHKESVSNTPVSKNLLSTQDKENVMSIFEMFGGEHNKQVIEKVYF